MITQRSPAGPGNTEVVNLIELPEELSYFNVLDAFDELDSGERLRVIDDLDLDWLCVKLKNERGGETEFDTLCSKKDRGRYVATIVKH